MSKFKKLKDKWEKGLYLCVGLDTDSEKIPEGLSVLDFNKKIVDATKDLVCAFKLNSAFYESEGPEVMRETVKYIKEKAPDVFLICDAKRGDIGNTNEGYTYFVESLGFDSLTIHPYLGEEANRPFLEHEDKLFFVLGKTSNPGSGEFQDLETKGLPLYLRVAKNVKEKWNTLGNVGLVVGATYPEHLMRARDEAGEDVVFLVPGVGAQGGDLKGVVQCGLNGKGGGMIINMSRSIIYASQEKDFAESARSEAEKFNTEVKKYLKLPRRTWSLEKKEFYRKRTMEIFEKTGAVIVDGHFVYQTGAHGNAYVAKDKITPDPILISEIGMMMAHSILSEEIDTVVAPAVGGIVLGHSVARYLSYFKNKTVNSVFIEKAGKDDTGKDTFKISRGYGEYLKDKKVAVIEDIVNTGYSVKKVIECVTDAGAKVTSISIICNRGKIKPKDLSLGATFTSLVDLDFVKYEASECPLCKNGVPINTNFGHGKK